MRRLSFVLAWAVLLVLPIAARAATPPPAVPRLPALHAVPDGVLGGRVVDALGRQVLLRGVNVNSLGEYWQGTSFAPTFPLEAGDPALMQALGFNTVRLVLSWSRVEPQRGVYDEQYLNLAAATVQRLAAAGIYTLIDMHQDAWSATLAARPGEVCQPPSQPAIGWDGAPAWATLVPDSTPRCFTGVREQNPAVLTAWAAFFDNQQGIQQAYADMWQHVAERFAGVSDVAGFDVMNEPNALEAQNSDLSRMYSLSLAGIRAGERAGRGFSHLVFFEPSVSSTGSANRGVPVRFTSDPNMVWSPHIYDGAFNNRPITSAPFYATQGTAQNLGGLPVVVGEWGTDAVRANRANDYFLAHEVLQDRFLDGGILWQWRQSCGDPHKAPGVVGGHNPADVTVKGLWDVDCTDNQILTPRLKVLADIQRGYVRAAAGTLTGELWDPVGRRFGATGTGRRGGPSLLAFYPLSAHVRTVGLTGVRVLPGPQGTSYVEARPRGGRWRLQIAPGPTTGSASSSLAARQRDVLDRATSAAAALDRRAAVKAKAKRRG